MLRISCFRNSAVAICLCGGMFVADNGIDWAISVTPDPRIPSLHEELRKIKGSNFEVVVPPLGYKKPR
jgi:hypothetical protein